MTARVSSANEQASAAPFDHVGVGVKVVSYTILIAGAFFMLLPFIWMASTACKPNAELATSPIRFFPENPPCLEVAGRLYEQSPDFNRYLLNSFIVTAARTLGQLITCSLAAYGFARYKFPGRSLLFALSLGLLIVPFQAILIPEFILIKSLGLRNTFGAIIIPGVFSAFALFLLRQAFMQIPIDLEEAAEIDGANPLQILWRITVPLSIPAIAAFAVITIQAAWNDFLFPLVVANTPDTRVVTIGIALLQGQRDTPYNLIMMGSLIATLPMLALFVLLQRYFIEGVAQSGLRR